jgi:hypothetical protein
MEATRRDFLATAATAAGAANLDAKSDDRSGTINIRDFGAACDGVRDDSPALEAAVNVAKALAKGGEVLIPGVTRIGRDMTIPENVALRFPQGAALSPARGKAIKVQGQWLAGAAPTIDLSQGGTVSFRDNGLQKEFIAEWWYLPYNASRDAAPTLNAMIDAVPDNATIRFMRGANAMLTLASTWMIRARVGLQIIAGPPIEESPALIIEDQPPLDGKSSTISLLSCGHCLLQGFSIMNQVAGNAINIGGNGPPRISTNNRIAYNRMTNVAANPNWTGIQIARAGEANNEFMEIVGNYIDGRGNASAGKGTGIYAGGNSNNHGHLLERNTCTGLAFGIDALWTGYRAYRMNFNSNQVDIRVGHLCYPTEIVDSDSEISRQFYVAGLEGGESSVIIRGARLAGLGAEGVAWIELHEYIGPTTIEGNDYQNYNHNNSRIYSFAWNAGVAGTAINLIGNNYGNMLRQGLPHANFIVRTGIRDTQGRRMPVNIIGEALSSGFAETFEENPAALVPAGNPATITVNALYNHVDARGGAMLQKINIAAGMDEGPMTAPNRRLRVFLVSNGGITAIAAGGNIMRAGVLPANSVTAFYYDPASGWWW